MSHFLALVVTAFIGVVFEYLPGGTAAQKILIICMCLMLVIAQCRGRFPKSSLGLMLPFLLYFVFCFVSSYIYTSSFVMSVASCVSLFVGMLFYLYVSVAGRSISIVALRSVIFYLVVIQFFFSLIKFVIHGIDEKVLIGSMSNYAGQLGFLFPALSVPLIFFIYNQKKSIFIPILLTMFMFLFGIINEKRSIIFIFPLIIMASIYVNRAHHGLRLGLPSMIAVATIGLAGMFIGISAIPSLNAGSEYGGAISLEHAFSYAITYLTMDYGGPLQSSYSRAIMDTGVQVGRIILWLSIIKWLIAADIQTFLFGAGFGAATPSVWLQDGNDPLFDIIGTRGAISGAGLSLVETGVVGFGLVTIFFVLCGVRIVRYARTAQTALARRWFYTLLIIYSVFCYDFFFYSTTLLRTLPISVIFFGLIATIPLVRQWDTAQSSRVDVG